VSEYQGRCHCGAVAVTLKTEKEPRRWPLRRCTCSFCVRFGGVYTSDPAGEIALQTDIRLRRYQFGQRTADFLFCPTCGVYFGAMTEIDGRKLAVLNVRVLDGITLDLATAQPMDFDEESVELRNARRLRHWTPLVLTEAAAP
jgi:hypothetical protein